MPPPSDCTCSKLRGQCQCPQFKQERFDRRLLTPSGHQRQLLRSVCPDLQTPGAEGNAVMLEFGHCWLFGVVYSRSDTVVARGDCCGVEFGLYGVFVKFGYFVGSGAGAGPGSGTTGAAASFIQPSPAHCAT